MAKQTGFLVRITIDGNSTERRIARPVSDERVAFEAKQINPSAHRCEETSDYGGRVLNKRGRAIGDYFIVPGSELRPSEDTR